MFEIEAVAVEGGRGGIIEHCLVRKIDTEDISQDGGGFSGGDSVGHIEGQDKAEDVLGVMDPRQVNSGFIRS